MKCKIFVSSNYSNTLDWEAAINDFLTLKISVVNIFQSSSGTSGFRGEFVNFQGQHSTTITIFYMEN